MELPKLWVGCVAREVLALNDMPIGITASENQVGFEKPGYTGLCASSVAERFPGRCQLDHGASTGSIRQAITAYGRAMIDMCTSQGFYEGAFEVGCGEDKELEEVKLKERIKRHREQAYCMSMWCGTEMHDCTNHVDLGALHYAVHVAASHGLPLRAHNFDWLPPAMFTIAYRSDVRFINVAPELGWVIARTYWEAAPDWWRTRVRARQETWSRWTESEHLAPMAAAHYHLESLPNDIREKHWKLAVANARAYLEERL